MAHPSPTTALLQDHGDHASKTPTTLRPTSKLAPFLFGKKAHDILGVRLYVSVERNSLIYTAEHSSNDVSAFQQEMTMPLCNSFAVSHDSFTVSHGVSAQLNRLHLL